MHRYRDLGYLCDLCLGFLPSYLRLLEFDSRYEQMESELNAFTELFPESVHLAKYVATADTANFFWIVRFVLLHTF